MPLYDIICDKCNNISENIFVLYAEVKDSKLPQWACTWCGAKGKTMIYWGMGKAPHVKTTTYVGDLWDKMKVKMPGDPGYNEAIIQDSKNKKIDGGKLRKRR